MNLQRAVECHLGDKYWKCNKRNNILHIKTSLGTHVALDRKEYYDSLVWVIVLLRNMTGMFLSIQGVQPQAFRNTCGHFCCWCQYVWKQYFHGRGEGSNPWGQPHTRKRSPTQNANKTSIEKHFVKCLYANLGAELNYSEWHSGSWELISEDFHLHPLPMQSSISPVNKRVHAFKMLV